MSEEAEYRRYLETLGEDVVRHRLASRMPVCDKPENNPPYGLVRAWLAEKVEARGRIESRRFQILLIVAVISAVAAVIAATPVIWSWLK